MKNKKLLVLILLAGLLIVAGCGDDSSSDDDSSSSKSKNQLRDETKCNNAICPKSCSEEGNKNCDCIYINEKGEEEAIKCKIDKIVMDEDDDEDDEIENKNNTKNDKDTSSNKANLTTYKCTKNSGGFEYYLYYDKDEFVKMTSTTTYSSDDYYEDALDAIDGYSGVTVSRKDGKLYMEVDASKGGNEYIEDVLEDVIGTRDTSYSSINKMMIKDNCTCRQVD